MVTDEIGTATTTITVIPPSNEHQVEQHGQKDGLAGAAGRHAPTHVDQVAFKPDVDTVPTHPTIQTRAPVVLSRRRSALSNNASHTAGRNGPLGLSVRRHVAAECDTEPVLATPRRPIDHKCPMINAVKTFSGTTTTARRNHASSRCRRLNTPPMPSTRQLLSSPNVVLNSNAKISFHPSPPHFRNRLTSPSWASNCALPVVRRQVMVTGHGK